MPNHAPQSLVNESLRRIQIPAASPRRSQESSFSGLSINWPSGLAPQPQPIDPAPSSDAPLPKVDAIVMVDTSAEAEAASDVLTPGYYYASHWYQYAHNFWTTFYPQLGPNAPALESHYLGQYFITGINGLKVLVYKTNLHMHTDGKLVNGSYTLPIQGMLQQMIDEAQPSVFLTTGTAGGTYCSLQLGDVVATRAAYFLCEQHYADAPFNKQTYKSDWTIPQKYAATAHTLMQGFAGNLTGKGTPPDPNCSCNTSNQYPANLYFDGTGPIPAFHPIITTDFFDYGTSTSGLDEVGVATEMDDAVLGLVCSQMQSPPNWASVRNYSDPALNGQLSAATLVKCADFYYSEYGYWTTVNSSIAAWAIVAGLGK